MKKTLTTISAFALVAVLFTAAYAAWTIDTNGVGFAGKGNVQQALNLNNAQLQNQASGLAFSYEDSAEYDVPCKKDVNKGTNRNTFDRKRSVSAAVSYEVRQGKKQITGFNLTGFGSTTISGNASCPEGWEADGAPVLVEGSETGGDLKVNGVNVPQTY
jgi:hypothetical protein